MADIKEITTKAAGGVKKLVKSPLFLAAAGAGVIALLWDSRADSGQETADLTLTQAKDYGGYPDVSGDVSTMADNMSLAMQDMFDTMNDSYLQMQQQQAEQFEEMKTEIDNKISNMEFVQKENVDAINQSYSAALYEQSSIISGLETKLDEAKASADAAKKEAEAAKAAAETAKKAATTKTTATKTTTTKTSTTSKSSGTKTVNNAIVNAVIRGDYGNGQARVKALTKAGYNASDVQKAVNKKLLG